MSEIIELTEKQKRLLQLNILELIVEVDRICKKNNIKLIRIPYWDIEKIEEIIIKQLIKCE